MEEKVDGSDNVTLIPNPQTAKHPIDPNNNSPLYTEIVLQSPKIININKIKATCGFETFTNILPRIAPYAAPRNPFKISEIMFMSLALTSLLILIFLQRD